MNLGRDHAIKELEAATGRILGLNAADGMTPLGTCFCVSSDGTVITAGHLLADFETYVLKLPGYSESLPLSIAERNYDHSTGTDYAVLKVEAGVNLPYVAVVSPQRCWGQTLQRGYPVSMNEQTTATGNFVGHVDVQERRDMRLFHFSSAEAGDKGFSGSPIYSVQAGGVVAVQTEGARKSAGPMSSSLLALPLFRIAGTLPISTTTRLSWRVRAFVRSIFANIAIASLAAVGLFAVLGISVVVADYVLSLQKQLEALNDKWFHELSAQESAFWKSEKAKQFVEAHQGEDAGWNKAIDGFLIENPPMETTVLNLAEIYEKASYCPLGSLCYNDSTCADLYPKIWNFYHAYKGVWDAYEARLHTRADADMVYFLKHYCSRQRTDLCRATSAAICK